jgi:hypothetical protein
MHVRILVNLHFMAILPVLPTSLILKTEAGFPSCREIWLKLDLMTEWSNALVKASPINQNLKKKGKEWVFICYD